MHTVQSNGTPPNAYITTSIPYVNAQPHIGHALEFLQADVLARYYRSQGFDTRFQTGTDENALKNVRAAAQEGISTAALVARNAAQFAALCETLDLAVDNFIRTGQDPNHRVGVHKFWQACAARGDIYKRTYSGLYCVGCEQFYETDELVAGRCPVHESEPELVSEENYFFRLSRYQDALLRLIEMNELRIIPETRRNEVLRFIGRGLRDFSISRAQERARGWGIPVPDDPSQVIYVWFDALINYITGLEYATHGPLFQQFWQPGAHQVHVIGKDILRFHAIYWPAMLLSAGLPLPRTLFVHGFLTVNGRKISKSTGTAVDPRPFVEQYGRDALRYYLLRKIPATGDGDFAEAELAQTYNTDLANQLGNLLQRVVRMVERYEDGVIPSPGAPEDIDRQLLEIAAQVQQQVRLEMEQFAFHKAVAAIWTLIAAANKYVVDVEPWTLARRRSCDGAAAARLATTLYALVATLQKIAQLLTPFLPTTAQEIAGQLGDPPSASSDGAAGPWTDCVAPGARVQAAKTLFPKWREEG